MTFRKHAKRWLYGSCPGLAGAFPYEGVKVYFPKKSVIFDIACKEGIYERQNTALVRVLAQPNTVYFDVGANIGLMALPVLRDCSSCTVVSFEPSPDTLGFLQRTARESGFKERWKIIGKGVAATPGELDFFMASSDLGAFNGLRDTGRSGSTRRVTVPVTTLDNQWHELEKPAVSLLKIDVEGAELDVLEGARGCIAQTHPAILLEWNLANVAAYKRPPEELLTIAQSLDYEVFSLPYGVPVTNSTVLKAQMISGENFLLLPRL